jgi:FkbM family methyltransferase
LERTFLDSLLESLLAAKGRLNLVQIGANDGRINDPIFPFAMRNKGATSILLIEPQIEIIPFLKESYADHPRATIHCGAIGAGDTLRLFRVKPELWNAYDAPYLRDAPAYRVPSGFASSSIEHVRRHARGNIRVDAALEDCIEAITVPCATLDALISTLPWDRDVDVLQVDAEGADDEVIHACDLDRLAPWLINFERAHLSASRRQALEAYLAQRGYVVRHWSNSDTVAVRRR